MTAALRAASWIRESTKNQFDNYGPDAQRAVIAATIAEHEWQDIGTEYVIAHSGLSVDKTPTWRAMLAAAGTDWDILVIGRTNRLSRRVRSQIEAVEAIHAAGGAVYFVREKTLSSNPDDWQKWMTEAVAAEAYSRTLAIDVTEGIGVKVRRTGIPWNKPPFGYTADWQLDPTPAATVRTIFATYTTGQYSLDQLAAIYDLAPAHIREIVKNRTYVGDVMLHGQKIRDGTFAAIIDPDTFAKARQIAQERQRAGGPPPKRPSLLRQRLWCSCGAHIRLDGRDGAGQPRVQHPEPICERWNTPHTKPKSRRQARYYTEPLVEALRNIRLTDHEIDRILSSAGATAAPPPIAINWAAQRRNLREKFDNGTITAADYIGLTQQLEENRQLDLDDAERAPRPDANRLRALLSDFSALIDAAKHSDAIWEGFLATYVARIEHEKANVIRIVPSDHAAGAILDHTFPKKVVLACPRGLEPPTFRSAT